MGHSLVALDAGTVVVAVRHLFRVAGIPALVVLSTVGALVSVGDALSAAPTRLVAAAGGVVGAGSLVLAGVAAGAGTPYGDAALLVGVVTLFTAAAVGTVGERIRFGHALAGAVLVAAAGGLVLAPRVGAFGWLDPAGAPLQSVALVFAGAGFLPLGYATRRRSTLAWPLAAAIVATPFLVALPTVPVGGLGPFFVGVVLLPWALGAAGVGSVLFALGWSASGPPAPETPRPRAGGGS